MLNYKGDYMMAPFTEILSSEKEIRDILGFPSELVKRKTIYDKGLCDVSPRGDTPRSTNCHQFLIC